MTITVIKGCFDDTPLTPHEVITTFEVNKGERTEIPTITGVDPCGDGQGCQHEERDWYVESGDAEIFVDPDTLKEYITANEDSVIFRMCYEQQ